MRPEFLSQTVSRLIGLGVTALLIYLYFSWQAKKQGKPVKKVSLAKLTAEVAAPTGFTKIFWVVFYFVVGLLLMAGGFYLWQNSAGRPVGYFLGGLVLGLIICYEGYTVVHPRKR